MDQIPAHYGGELFAIDLAREKAVPAQARSLWQEATTPGVPAQGILTEEQFWSVLYARHATQVAPTADLIKRLWTAPRHNTVLTGDENLPLWHLPAEKRHGFRDLFIYLAARDFSPMPPEAFKMLAGPLCGVPRKGIMKWMRDGLRQVGRRMRIQT